MTRQHIFILSSVLCLLALCAGAYTIWNAWWLVASVEAMSEDMEREGAIDAARVAVLRAAHSNAYPSTGIWLMQGRDRATLIGLLTLSGIAVIGFGTIAALTLRAGVTPSPAATR